MSSSNLEAFKNPPEVINENGQRDPKRARGLYRDMDETNEGWAASEEGEVGEV